MIIVNLMGAPGSGKSTTAAHVFSYLKRHDINTELVGEFAKELIYLGNEIQLVNQVYLMANQYRKLKDLERYGATLVISDSPLLMQTVYCENIPYCKEITALNYKLNEEFHNVDVFIRRVKKYQTFGRVHDEDQSDALSKKIWDLKKGEFHYVIDGDTDGADFLAKEALKIADGELLHQFHLEGAGNLTAT